jgi:SAM-dependent methyltransferase
MGEDRGVVAWTAEQYRDDRNLRARQRLWQRQSPWFDLTGWVLGLGEVAAGQRVLDLGCGNGLYLRALGERPGVEAVGCDLSPGMLRAVGPHPALVNGDAMRLPFRTGAFDVVLAPHMLYHVPDPVTAAGEMRRVLRPGGVAVVVTNGRDHMRSLREIIEAAVRRSTPGWEMANPSTHVFSLENGAAALTTAFDEVDIVRPGGAAAVRLDDADIAADYVASVGDHYEHEVAAPWDDVVAEVRRRVRAVIDAEGVFAVAPDSGAFVCR